MVFKIICLLSLGFVSSAPTSTKISETDNALSYLSRFGYMPNKDLRTGFMTTEESLRIAVREFQEFANLKTTGELDNATKAMMKVPRCGVKDKRSPPSMGKYSRFRRYVLHGSKWRTLNLSYRISKYPSDLGKSDTDEDVRRAFTEWSKVSPLTFSQRTTGQANIDIRFEVGNHDDDDPFDGPGGTLAHAYFPAGGGDVHFDDEEAWTVKSRRGTNLFRVAVHEFGHSLGLEHSKVRNAIMYPFYSGYNPDFEFHSDDINGIQSIYGPKETDSREEVKPKNAGSDDKIPRTPFHPDTGNDNNDLCEDGKFDAAFGSLDGSIYVLKGSLYWIVSRNGIALGYPKPISERWIGLPSNIDAAFGLNGRIYFFKGSKYWSYSGATVDKGYPKEIRDGFGSIPNNLDGAFWAHYYNKGYFFKGDKYWVYDAEEEPSVKSSYPKSITDFKGIPSNLDDALMVNGRILFFKNGLYYRISDLALEYNMDDMLPPLPRSVRVLFECFSTIKEKK